MSDKEMEEANKVWNMAKWLRFSFVVTPILLALWISTNTLENWATIEFVVLFLIILFRIAAELQGSLRFSKTRVERLFSLQLLLGFSLTLIAFFAAVYKYFGLVIGGVPTEPSWTECFYFSIVTWTTLGYGDIQPINSLRLVAAFQAYIGYIYMALVAGGIAGLLFNLGASEESRANA